MSTRGAHHNDPPNAGHGHGHGHGHGDGDGHGDGHGHGDAHRLQEQQAVSVVARAFFQRQWMVERLTNTQPINHS
jgi:hypothetical protein